MSSNLEQAQRYFESLQETITGALEELDETGHFREDHWTHRDGGGGRTRILQDAAIFEKAGVNFSSVSGMLTNTLARRLEVTGQRYSASGISLVLHPMNPMVPTVHANFRYLELGDGTFWFGGGADLTPWYLFEDDARHFHGVWKRVCDTHDPTYYPRFKKWCDEYFFLQHRGETRGIGGIFFDYLKGTFDSLFGFVKHCGDAFLESYVPIIEARNKESWGQAEKDWQLLRR